MRYLVLIIALFGVDCVIFVRYSTVFVAVAASINFRIKNTKLHIIFFNKRRKTNDFQHSVLILQLFSLIYL